MADVSRLSRTERVLFGAALAAAALPGCAGGTKEPEPPPPVAVPAYGAPAPAPDAGTGEEPDEATPSPEEGTPIQPEQPPGPEDPGTMRPMYGVPPPPK